MDNNDNDIDVVLGAICIIAGLFYMVIIMNCLS